MPIIASLLLPMPVAGWRVRGRIVAQGGTPEQALHAAQLSRHKEKPEIIYMPVSFSYSPLIDKVRDILPDQEIYLVGGAVRDMLLNRLSHDLDFAVPSKGIPSPGAPLTRSKLISWRSTWNAIRAASSSPNRMARVPFWISPPIAAETWMKTCALAIYHECHCLRSARRPCIDPLNGASTCRQIDPRLFATSLSDDPVRILRAIPPGCRI